MTDKWSRRKFLGRGAVAAGAMAAAGQGRNAFAWGAAASPFVGRYVTHISIVRVNQVQVTRHRNLGKGEAPLNSPKHIRARREAFGRGCPNGRMTWAVSWLALQDERKEYKEARKLLASYHDRYGDEITFIPGAYFAPMYNTREQIKVWNHEGLAKVSEMVGGGYRPQCLVAGFMDAENQRDLAREEGIHVCQGQIWSQLAIDHGDCDGGISYPYYPSRQHYLKPAQGPEDFIDCVCLDGWTCDFLAARRPGFQGGFNSRMGVGPIETVGDLGRKVGRMEMMATTAIHLDRGHALNGFGWVTGIWETSLGHDADLEWWLQSLQERWPDTQVMTEGEFGLQWRAHVPNNDGLNYRFVEKGSGAPGSAKDMEIRWYMNQEFRLALLRNWEKKSPYMAIDFTRYDLPMHPPKTMQRDWNLMNVLNQKGTRPQDKPKRLGQLPEADQGRIYARYPELKGWA